MADDEVMSLEDELLEACAPIAVGMDAAGANLVQANGIVTVASNVFGTPVCILIAVGSMGARLQDVGAQIRKAMQADALAAQSN